MMAPRRRCRNRIRSVCCLSEASCRRFPISVPAAWGPRASGAPSSGSPSLAYFSWRSKRSRSAAGPRPGLVVRQAMPHCFIRRKATAAKPPLTFSNGCTTQGAHATPAWRVKQRRCACQTTKPGIRPGGRPAFCFAKKWGKKATPMMAVRAAHGLHTPPAP